MIEKLKQHEGQYYYDEIAEKVNELVGAVNEHEEKVNNPLITLNSGAVGGENPHKLECNYRHGEIGGKGCICKPKDESVENCRNCGRNVGNKLTMADEPCCGKLSHNCGMWIPVENKSTEKPHCTDDPLECPVLKKFVEKDALDEVEERLAKMKDKPVCFLCKGKGGIPDSICTSRLCPECHPVEKPSETLEDVIEERLKEYFLKHVGVDDYGCKECKEYSKDLAEAIKEHLREKTGEVYAKMYPEFDSTTIKEPQVAVMDYIGKLREELE